MRASRGLGLEGRVGQRRGDDDGGDGGDGGNGGDGGDGGEVGAEVGV